MLRAVGWQGVARQLRLKGEAIPVASRLTMIAEFAEVAHRIRGIRAATKLAKSARRFAVRSHSGNSALCQRRVRSSTGSMPRANLGRRDQRRGRT